MIPELGQSGIIRGEEERTSVVIALAGRRTDAADAEQERFPLQQTDLVRQRLLDLFSRRKAMALVCSAACGADLLALDIARELGIRRRIILPFAPDRYRETSVADRPGDWGPLFDRILKEVTIAGDLVVLGRAVDDGNAYLDTNLAILDHALLLAHEKPGTAPEETNMPGCLAVAVWEGTSRGAGDMTAAFLDEARRRGFEIAEVLTG